ncbi:MAG: metallophosphoesterase family protein [Acidimicrobiia bacterium]
MRILHTSDWHVGKGMRGQSRLDEHVAVLAEIAEIAAREAVDLVVVAGDLYESASPTADADKVVFDALLGLRAVAPVVVIAGNHDNGARFEAIRPVFDRMGIVVRGRVAPPDDGGVVDIDVASGERARVAMLPFCSPRHAVRAAELMALDAAAASGEYAAKLAALVERLCADPDPGAVNLLVAHCMVRDGRTGGGERAAQTSFEPYWLSATAFPASLAYGALGHLHLGQRVPTGAPVWYSGSPIQVDFGEAGAGKQVLLVDVTAQTPARVTPVPLTAGVELVTVTGTVEEIAGRAGEDFADAWIRVRVEGPGRAGIVEDVRGWLGERVVDVRVLGSTADAAVTVPTRMGSTPHELFAEFLQHEGIADARLASLFADLLDAETSG